MPEIKTTKSTSLHASPHPQANREVQEEYLSYNYPKLVLLEDFTSGVGRKTRYFAVLNDKEKSTIYFEKGTQQYSTLLEIQHEAFKGEWFRSAFTAAKALSDYLEKGTK